MQNELKPISFYEEHPECVPCGTYVQEFEDAIFVPFEPNGQWGCSSCCLKRSYACFNEKGGTIAACVPEHRVDGKNGYFILKPTGPAMATAGFSYGSMGEEVQ